MTDTILWLWALAMAGTLALTLLSRVSAGVGARLDRRRYTGRPWRPGLRWLCGAGQHTLAVRVPDEAAPCTYETRCTTCEQVVERGVSHAYGPNGPRDARCARTATCVRCGDERRAVQHRTRLVVTHDLTDEERGHVPAWLRPGPCDVFEICGDCGDLNHKDYQQHDPDPADWRGACLRCGDWDDIDE